MTVGFGYVPARSPPAVPFIGREVGITPGASLSAVIVPVAILFPVITLSAITGLGYEPLKSPPALPFGGRLAGMTPVASFSIVTEPS